MRKKLLQNTLFAAIAAWTLYGVQLHLDTAEADRGDAGIMVSMNR